MSEEPALDRRPPAPRKPRGAGIYVAYSIAGALLVGAGALSLGHLSAYRPGAKPATSGQRRRVPAPTGEHGNEKPLLQGPGTGVLVAGAGFEPATSGL